LLPFFILCQDPWSQLFFIHLLLLPCCLLSLVHLSRVFLLLPELSMYWTITPLQSAWNYLSNEWSFIPIGLEQESYALFTLCKLSQADFRMCDAQRFGCNFLHGSPKMLILNALESGYNGALEYPNFPFFTSLNMSLILMKTAVPRSGFWRCWWSWFQLLLRTHGSDSPCLQITIMHKVPPRWPSGILTICQQTMTSLRSSLVA
jgi:hypothetical protein